jgi:HEPN domain-containing protein
MPSNERWLQISRDDLLAAQHLAKVELYYIAVYHCQQSAEKALKYFLESHQYPLLKTHDLVDLLTMCCEKNREFEKLLSSAEHLNPFATKFRYPSEYDVPDASDTLLAIRHAQRIYKFVSRIAAENKTGQEMLF